MGAEKVLDIGEMAEQRAPVTGLSGATCVSRDMFAPPPEASEAGQRWSCLYTRPRHEKSIAVACESDGVRCYLPLVKSVKHYGKRKREHWLPLFPGYVFCCGEPAQTYSLGRLKNVLSVIEAHDQERLVGELREIGKALAVSAELETIPRLGKGKRVRIAAGPFRGIVGTVSEVRNRFRVLLSVSLTGRSIPLEVDAGVVELAP